MNRSPECLQGVLRQHLDDGVQRLLDRQLQCPAVGECPPETEAKVRDWNFKALHYWCDYLGLSPIAAEATELQRALAIGDEAPPETEAPTSREARSREAKKTRETRENRETRETREIQETRESRESREERKLGALFRFHWRHGDSAQARLRVLCHERLQRTLSGLSGCRELDGRPELATFRELRTVLGAFSRLPAAQVDEANEAGSGPLADRTENDAAGRDLRLLLRWSLENSRQREPGRGREYGERDKERGRRPELHDCLGQRLGRLAELCSGSDWSFDYFIRSGMAACCRELDAIGVFIGQAGLREAIAGWTQALGVLHIRNDRPAPETLEAMLAGLMRLDLGLATEPGSVVPAAPLTRLTPGAGLRQLVDSELRHTVGVLRQALQGLVAHRVTTGSRMDSRQRGEAQGALRGCYRLSWSLQVLGRQTLCDLGLCLYQVLQQYCQYFIPVPAALHRQALAYLKLVEAPAAAADVAAQAENARVWRALLRGFVRLSPVADMPADTAVVLNGKRGGGTLRLHLSRLPDYLSRSFAMLLGVREEYFANPRALAARRDGLGAELILLEQGAAALKLEVLEHYSCRLLDLHLLLDQTADTAEFPGALLWRAHRHLVALLDHAASWQESRPDEALVDAMAQWMEQAETRLNENAGQGREPRDLLGGLLAFSRQAGTLLDRSVRLHCSFSGAAADWPRDLMPVLARSCRELLRWMLLQGEDDSELRRRHHRPLAIGVTLHIEFGAGGRCLVVVEDDCELAVPEPERRRRLHKLLGRRVRTLSCENPERWRRRFGFEFGDGVPGAELPQPAES